MKGIDEKFEVNPANGTASFSIPLPFSPNRNGFTPSVSISYNSGAGNSILGVGWSLNFPIIQRKTDKELPRYFDYSDDEDTFMFSGVEDLVPKLNYKEEEWKRVEHKINNDYLIQEYRPRIEGAFSRIERIREPEGNVYWWVTTSDNVTTIFGRNPDWRIADPDNESHIFQWLPEMSFDDKGSVILFEFEKEDGIGFNEELYDQNRFNENGTPRFINRYLKRVKYGNVVAFYPYNDAESPFDPKKPDQNDRNWHFQLVLDYGEHNTNTLNRNIDWIARRDPFSSYRAGFEIRTCRLLKRALMFHHFEELNGGMPTLVRSLDFTHEFSDIEQTDRETELEFLKSITQCGYIWLDGENRYSKKSLPSMDSEYQALAWDNKIRNVEQEELVHAPVGLSANYHWVDLYNEGISGILTEQGGGWFYKHNLGDVEEPGKVDFEPAKIVMSRPSFTGLSEGTLTLQDLEANGEKQLVVNQPGLEGFFEMHEDGSWEPFRVFIQEANIDIRDPNVRLFDINGDSIPEIVMTEEDAFLWFPNQGKEGYEEPRRTFKSFDEEQGPAIVFSDPEQSIFLADMSGDGLTDIVRIRNREVCYWPNLGHGRFGRKVTMGNSPIFDIPELFNPNYLQLADISGTGATDIIYLGKNKFQAYLNLSGNKWGEPEIIEPFFPTEQPNRISVVDLLGNGTGCIVWSSELPGYSQAPMRYIDLMGGRKPHIMTRYLNNFGKIVSVEYKSSTWYYLKDKKDGKPWITKLPFPVQCVRKTTVEDKITGLVFSNSYEYHHGYYDHTEREFRGFGMVEQRDTETFGELRERGAANAEVKTLHQPPILTKTWFHTGAFLDREHILDQFEQEYWYNNSLLTDLNIQPVEAPLPDAPIMIGENIPNNQHDRIKQEMTADEWKEAFRACKGMMLRQEVFAEDAKKENPTEEELLKQAKPYSVATHNCEIQLLQARSTNPYAVFVVKESEAITYHYERNHEDPRVAHTLNIEVDEYGNILKSASVAYPRLQEEADFYLANANGDPKLEACLQKAKEAQNQFHVIYTVNVFTNDVFSPPDNPGFDPSYRLRILWDTKTYEIYTPANRAKMVEGKLNLFRLAEFIDPLQQEKAYYETVSQEGDFRLIERVKTFYLRDDLTDIPLGDGLLGKRGLVYENYQLAYTNDLLATIFRSEANDNTAPIIVGANEMNEAQFHFMEEQWWIRSGRMEYEEESVAEDHFLLPIAYRDPMESRTRVSYDNPHLYVRQIIDAADNINEVVAFDYRTLSPRRTKDLNDDLSEVMLDELSLVKAMAVMGKGNEADDLNGLITNATEEDENFQQDFWNLVEEELTDSDALHQSAKELLRHATARFVYDFDRAPMAVASILREKHHQKLVREGQVEQLKVQVSLEYSGGMGQVAMQKAQAEPGNAKRWANGTVTPHDTGNKLRWIGNGRTVFNNKGNPILQYEPYFSTSARYENASQLVEHGVAIQLSYDPLGRQIRTDFPDKTYGKVEFSPWWQTVYDQNDTAVRLNEIGNVIVDDSTEWYQERISYTGNDPIQLAEKKAAQRVAIHADTPVKTYLDSLGRPFLTKEHNRWQTRTNGAASTSEEHYYTRVEIDIEGNVIKVLDARFNTVMEYQYDLLGHRVYQNSMDAGKQWLFNNVLGNPVKSWDQRRHIFSYQYDDLLHRPTSKHIRGGDGDHALDHVYERIVYGENQPDDKDKRLRGQPYQQFDTSGLVSFDEYDFKGNLLQSKRQLLQGFTSIPNWDANPDLEDEEFFTETVYDALNRPLNLVAPHTADMLPSVVSYAYNPAGLLEQVLANVRESGFREYVSNIDYNEKGQRTLIQYGNGIATTYQYDSNTFRLTKIDTRNADKIYQLLQYAYDPIGNLTAIRDDAQQRIYFDGQVVDPHNEFAYDALYRLIAASGREHIGQNHPSSWNDDFRTNLPHPHDGQAMRRYVQCYEYDAVGNILAMIHKGGMSLDNPGNTLWHRFYNYEIENNRLVSTSQQGENRTNTPYSRPNTPQYHDLYPHHQQHGYIENLPHLQEMQWNFREELQKTVKQDGGNPTDTLYMYDVGGQRTRKINATANGVKRNVRIYLGGFEIYRQYSAGDVDLERESLHIMDGEQRIAIVETKTLGAVTNDSPDRRNEILPRYQFGNHLGSVMLELGQQDGNLIEITYEEYHPYGTTSYQAKNRESRAAKKRYRYTGKERDEESGLYYHGARYYVPWLGRWVNSDPLGLKDEINTYLAIGNNPMIFVDRKGTEKEKVKYKAVTRIKHEGAKITVNRQGPTATEFEARQQAKRERLYPDLLNKYDEAKTSEEKEVILEEIRKREEKEIFKAMAGFYILSGALALGGWAGAELGSVGSSYLGLGSISSGALQGASAGVSAELTRGFLFEIGMEENEEFQREGMAAPISVGSLLTSALTGGAFGAVGGAMTQHSLRGLKPFAIFDTGALDFAMKGNKLALAHFRSHNPVITKWQLREFIGGKGFTQEQRIARLNWLIANKVSVWSDPRIVNAAQYKEAIGLLNNKGYPDAASIGIARALNMRFITTDRKLIDYLEKTLRLTDFVDSVVINN